MTERVVFEDMNTLACLCGENDNRIKLVEDELGVEIFPKGNELKIKSENKNVVNEAKKALELMYDRIKSGKDLENNDVKFLLGRITNSSDFSSDDMDKSSIIVSKSGKIIKARNNSQFEYMKTVMDRDVVFSIGPAGTGKTYLAVAMGIHAILTGSKKRLILTRPVVEAGENLGFLPGDLQQKINPYLRPLFDALLDMLGFDDFAKYKEREVIEIAPLAYMRGRTLNNAFIILDEAQNTTVSQMKMFLTRIGETSKVIVTGDITQIDLPNMRDSGLIYAKKILSSVPEIGFNNFTNKDVVRHPLVKKIIEAFENDKKISHK